MHGDATGATVRGENTQSLEQARHFEAGGHELRSPAGGVGLVCHVVVRVVARDHHERREHSLLVPCGARGGDNILAGRFSLDGADVTNLPEHKRAAFIGRVFQDPMMGTAPSMWIEENLALAARRGQRRGLSWGVTKEEKEQYRELLGGLGLGLESRLTTKVSTLSGGQRRALTLLLATLERPELFLLDEHTAALDPKTAAKVMELTDRIVREGQLTTLMITHNMRDAIQYGNRLIMLHDGHVILDIAGEEKKKLTVPDLLEQFTKASGDEFANDRAILS